MIMHLVCNTFNPRLIIESQVPIPLYFYGFCKIENLLINRLPLLSRPSFWHFLIWLIIPILGSISKGMKRVVSY